MTENKTTLPPQTSDWKIPLWLLVLTLIPVVAGIVRLIDLSIQTEITPENSRFFASPTPVIIHIVAVTFYCVLGAFQFSSGLRKKNLSWHRLSGRFLIPAGIISAITGLWMTVFYPLPNELQGPLLLYFRIFIGSAMVVCLVLGYLLILKRKISEHKAWMIRAYAIGQGTGTQVLTILPWTLFIGTPDQLTRDLLMILAWVINLGVAEWIVRK